MEGGTSIVLKTQDLELSGKQGVKMASIIIQQFGARLRIIKHEDVTIVSGGDSIIFSTF